MAETVDSPVLDSLAPDVLEQERLRNEANLDRLYQQLGEAPETGPGRPATQAEPLAQDAAPRTTSRFEPDLPSADATYRFLRELPGRTVLGGIRDAGQQQISAFAEYLDWGSDKAARGEWGALLAAAYFPALGRATMAKKSGEAESGDITAAADETLPDLPDPTTPAGEMARAVVQFSTAFMGPFKGLQKAGMGSMAASLVSGAIADGTAFDPHQQRLANLIQEYPTLENPVTEFLASKPSDSRAMGRFKNAVEGLGLGLAAEGFVRSINILRQSRAAKGVTAPIEDVAGTAKITPADLAPLGDPKGDLVTAVEVPKKVRPALVETATERKLRAAAGETTDAPPGSLLEADGGRGVYINWARINEPDDIKQVIQTAADLHKTSIDEARRGVMTQEATQQLADDLGMSVDDLLRRQQGQAFNAETAVAARKLLNVSAEKLTELARRAASPNAGAVDVFNFRQHMATHHAIQKEVISARTETARALASWRIPVGGGEEQARAISAMMDSFGGDSASREFAKRLAVAADAGALNSQSINDIVRRGALARSFSAIQEAWINGLLSNPVTHAVNAMSNTGVAINSIVERAAAGQGAAAIGATDGVVIGEAGQMLVGMVEGIKDNWRVLATHNRMVGAAKKMAGLPGRIPDNGVVMRAPGLDLSKLDSPIREAISAENAGLRSDTLLGKVADGFGAAVRTPGRALEESDQMFKTLGYRMELHAQAFRQATQEGLEGAALKRRTAELVANPSERLRMAAVDNALYQTFTQQLGELGQSLMRLRNKVPGGFLLLPFVRTPSNILKYSFSRTPLAPLGTGVRADLAAGGARAQLAYTRMALGTAAQLAALDAVYSGVISGNGPPDKKSRDALLRQGWQPYSLKVGDRWYSYQRLDPLNTVLGTAADVAEFTQWAGREMEDPEAETGELYSAAVLALGNTLVNKTYLSSAADAIQAVQDPHRARSFVTRLTGSVVPAGVAQAARINDPYLLEVRSILDSVKARTPGWSKDLPAVRDLWGRPIEYRSGLGAIYDAMSPVYSRRERPSPIDEEMLRLRMGMEKPDRVTGFNGVPINLEHFPWAYDRYVELAGNGLKGPVHNLGAKDYLDALVGGKLPESEVYKRLSDGPDGGKVDFIRSVVGQYRALAREQVLHEFMDVARAVDHRRTLQQQEAMQAALQQ